VKNRETDEEERLASEHVGQPSKGEQDGRDDDEIADQHPLDIARQRGGTPNACAMDGRPMLTIEESSVVMKVAVPERASTIHLFARSARSTGVGLATSACACREAAWPQSADETTRAIGAERDGLDSAPNILHRHLPTGVAASVLLIDAFAAARRGPSH